MLPSGLRKLVYVAFWVEYAICTMSSAGTTFSVLPTAIVTPAGDSDLIRPSSGPFASLRRCRAAGNTPWAGCPVRG